VIPNQFVTSKRWKEDWEANCPKHTSYIESIREESFFSSFKMPINRVMYIIHHLASGCSTASIKKLIGNIDRKSITGILTKLQELMIPIAENHKPKYDSGDLIEIDEIFVPWEIPGYATDNTLAGKKGTWLLGIINRSRTKLWIEPIKNRGKTEISRVLDSVLPEEFAWIFTDALATYSYLEADHIHFVINKSQEGYGRKSLRLITNGTYIHSKRRIEQLKQKYPEWIVHVNVNMIENNWMLFRKLLVLTQGYRHPHMMIYYLAEYVYNFYKLDWFNLIRIIQ
jgi:hypothetical protein